MVLNGVVVFLILVLFGVFCFCLQSQQLLNLMTTGNFTTQLNSKGHGYA
jgi:hypothetical protein